MHIERRHRAQTVTHMQTKGFWQRFRESQREAAGQKAEAKRRSCSTKSRGRKIRGGASSEASRATNSDSQEVRRCGFRFHWHWHNSSRPMRDCYAPHAVHLGLRRLIRAARMAAVVGLGGCCRRASNHRRFVPTAISSRRLTTRDISQCPTHRVANLDPAPDSRTGCLEIIAHLRG